MLRRLPDKTIELQKDVYGCFTEYIVTYTETFDRVCHEEFLTTLKIMNNDDI